MPCGFLSGDQFQGSCHFSFPAEHQPWFSLEFGAWVSRGEQGHCRHHGRRGRQRAQHAQTVRVLTADGSAPRKGETIQQASSPFSVEQTEQMEGVQTRIARCCKVRVLGLGPFCQSKSRTVFCDRSHILTRGPPAPPPPTHRPLALLQKAPSLPSHVEGTTPYPRDRPPRQKAHSPSHPCSDKRRLLGSF